MRITKRQITINLDKIFSISFAELKIFVAFIVVMAVNLIVLLMVGGFSGILNLLIYYPSESIAFVLL